MKRELISCLFVSEMRVKTDLMRSFLSFPSDVLKRCVRVM